jgi:DNA-binding CsgD family transcriptional regulator
MGWAKAGPTAVVVAFLRCGADHFARVVGLLHADRYLQDKETSLVDRKVLYSFAQGLRLALSRAAIAERLQSAGRRLEIAAAHVDGTLSGIRNVSLDVSSNREANVPPRGSPESPRSVIDVLTCREVEVLELIAQGCTNAGVAAAKPVVSEGTVKQHGKHVLCELHVGNRSEAVSRLYASTGG